METQYVTADVAPERIPQKMKNLFLAYMVISVLQFIPTVLLTGTMLGLFGILTSLIPSVADWFTEDTVDPLEVRIGWPRVYLHVSSLFIAPYFLLGIIAVGGTFVGSKGSSGNNKSFVEEKARKLARLIYLNMLAALPAVGSIWVWGWMLGPLAILEVALLFAHFVISIFLLRYIRNIIPADPRERWVLWLSFILLLLSFVQLGLAAIISGNASCACAWDNYSTAMRVFHALGSATSIGACILGIVPALSSFLNNSDEFTGRRLLMSAMACNAVVLVIGVPVTAIVNRAMFLNNDQDLGDSHVFAAAFEQTFLSLCLLTTVIGVEGTLTWTLQPVNLDLGDMQLNEGYHADIPEISA